MKQRILLYSILALLLSGCVPAKISDWPSPHLNTRNRQAEIELALQQENYQTAIKLLRTERTRGRSQQRFDAAWIQVLNGLFALAEGHLNDKEYTEAGHLYRAVSTNFPTSSALAGAVEMDRAQLESRLDDCADQLLELGLLAYRQGELRQAVASWNKISAFHPQHAASQRALTTARLQLQNLETLSTN